jgi:hypothetical protein
MRFAREAEVYSLPLPLAGFRRHDRQKTAGQMQEYLQQARESFKMRGGHPPNQLKGFWLKVSGKFLRFLQRRHAYTTAQQGFGNHCYFSGNGSRWRLNNH